MSLFYSLQIYTSSDKYETVDEIIGVKSNYPEAGWGLQLVQNDEDEYIYFIDYFLSILNGKYDTLEKIGIAREDISIWMLYEYEGQCNMEFSPKDMYNLGKEGIEFCISCWEK